MELISIYYCPTRGRVLCHQSSIFKLLSSQGLETGQTWKENKADATS